MLSEKLLSDIHNVLSFYIECLNTKMGLLECDSLKLNVLNYENLDVEIVETTLKLRLYNPFASCIYSEIKLDIPLHYIAKNYESYITNLVSREFDTVGD